MFCVLYDLTWHLHGPSDYPRTLQDSIICMFNILYKRVDMVWYKFVGVLIRFPY